MDNLYVENLQFEKVAMTYMDSDNTKWVKQIVTEFLGQYPMLQNQVINIQWIKKDTNKGYAVGVLKILNGAVPVIISDFKMFPLDVIMYGSAALPLTQDTLNELTSSPSPFKGIANVGAKSNLQIFGDKIQFSPVDFTNVSDQANTTTRDAIKVASFIDRIEHIDRDSVIALVKAASEDPRIEALYDKNKTSGIFKKLASRELVSNETNIESLLRESEIDRQYVFHDEVGNTFLKQANSKIDHTWTIELDGSEDIINLVNNTDKSVLVKQASDESEYIIPKPGDVGSFDSSDDIVEIYEFKKKASLKKSAILEYLDGSGNLYIDNKANYVDIPYGHVKVASTSYELDGYEPNVGDYGVFAIGEKATRPFSIIGMQKIAGQSVSYEIFADHGIKQATYLPTRAKGNALIPHETIKSAYYVPGKAKFVKLAKNLGNNVDTIKDLEKVAESSSKEDKICVSAFGPGHSYREYEFTKVADIKFKLKKEANSNAAINSNNIIEYDGVSYKLHGEVLNKYAQLHFPEGNISKNDCIWSLVHCGGSKSDIAKLAMLKSGELVTIGNKLTLPISPSEIIKVASQQYDMNPVFLNKNLVKEAAVLTDASTVDAVLSLGLIKKFNIMEYLQLIPDYERIMGELAKLLIMIRLGLAQVPELPVKTAMETVTSVVYSLKQLQTITQINNTNNH